AAVAVLALGGVSVATATPLAVGEGRLIRFQGSAKTVFVADPAVADIQVPSQNAVLIMGKKAGQTTLYVLDDAGNTIIQQNVQVRHPTGEITQVLRQRFPGLRISLESAPGSLMISGAVPDSQTVDAILRTVKAYLGETEELIN